MEANIHLSNVKWIYSIWYFCFIVEWLQLSLTLMRWNLQVGVSFSRACPTASMFYFSPSHHLSLYIHRSQHPSLALSRSLSLSLALYRSIDFYHSLSLSITLYRYLSLSIALSRPLSPSLALSFARSLPLSLFPSLSPDLQWSVPLTSSHTNEFCWFNFEIFRYLFFIW